MITRSGKFIKITRLYKSMIANSDQFRHISLETPVYSISGVWVGGSYSIGDLICHAAYSAMVSNTFRHVYIYLYIYI